MILGLDIGHSAVKMSYKLDVAVQQTMFPSVITPAFRINDDAAEREAKKYTVSVDDEQFFFGEFAITQGGKHMAPSQDADWVGKKSYVALTKAAQKFLAMNGLPEPHTIVIGLPISIYNSQRTKANAVTKYVFPNAKIAVVSQPAGVFFDCTMDEFGNENIKTDGAWGIIDIGHFSTDIIMMKNGEFIEKASGSDAPGIRIVVEQFQKNIASTGHRVGLVECADILKNNNKMIAFKKTIDLSKEASEAKKMLITIIENVVTEKFADDLRILDGIILAGGGAHLLQKDLSDLWPHVETTENPRFSIASGFMKLGVSL